MEHSKIKTVLQKVISKDLRNALTKEEKKALIGLAEVLEKAAENKSLNESEVELLKEITHKSKTGTITVSDFVNLVKVLFHAADFFKDYS